MIPVFIKLLHMVLTSTSNVEVTNFDQFTYEWVDFGLCFDLK